jgi:hypothetical protein
MSTPLTAIDFNKNYSKIVDLRETNEFTIDVPFKWKTPWKSIPASIDPANPTWPCYNEPMAMLYLTVINSLRSGPSAASSIEFLVETSALDDFEVAYPDFWQSSEPFAGPFHIGESSLAPPEGRMDYNECGMAQSGLEMVPASKQGELTVNAFTMGEAVRSVRQLLKRYTFCNTSALPFSSSSGAQVLLPNLDLPSYTQRYVPGSSNDPWDYFSWFSLIFRFMSGSMRVMILQNDNSTGVRYVTITPANTSLVNFNNTNGPYQFMLPQPEQLAEFGVPFYQMWPAVPTLVNTPTVTNSESTEASVFIYQPSNAGTWFKSQGGGATQIYRSIGEDFSFGYLIGPPVTAFYIPPSP